MTEEKMAYYELARLSKEVDDLLKFLVVFLTIKKLLTNLFIQKVGEVLRILEVERTATLPEQLVEEILSLAIPIGDDIFSKLRERKSWYADIVLKEIGTGIHFRMLLGLVRNSVEKINSITETRLEKFLDDTDLYDNWKELRNNLQVVTCREAVRSLVQAGRELKEALNFFHDVGKETDLLSQYLKFLTTLFENSKFQKECNGLEMVKCIGDIASKALDAVNSPEKDSLHFRLGVALSLEHSHLGGIEQNGSEQAAQLYFEIDLSLEHSPVARIEQNGFEQAAKEYFEGKNGIRLVLLETLGKLHFFEGEINMICKKIGKEEFQSRNASRSSSRSWSTSCPVHLSVFPPLKSRKRKEIIPEENESVAPEVVSP